MIQFDEHIFQVETHQFWSDSSWDLCYSQEESEKWR